MQSFSRALITGASSGLGREIAIQLAADGTELVLTARREDQLRKVAREVEAAGGRAHVVVLDVSDAQRAREVVRSWDHRLGGFDLVLANAGIGAAAHTRDLEWADIERVLDVNVRGAFAILHAASGPMLERGTGTLAGMSSLAGLRGMPGSGVYSASKAALSIYLETLRVDTRALGLRVVDIRPGYVHTPMTAGSEKPLPFVIDVETAARHSIRGMKSGRAVVAYPWRAAWAVRAMALLPNGLWNVVAARMRRD